MKTPVGMTNLRAVAHLGMSGAGWTESKTNCRNELREWKTAKCICRDESQRPFCQLQPQQSSESDNPKMRDRRMNASWLGAKWALVNRNRQTAFAKAIPNNSNGCSHLRRLPTVGIEM